MLTYPHVATWLVVLVASFGSGSKTTSQIWVWMSAGSLFFECDLENQCYFRFSNLSWGISENLQLTLISIPDKMNRVIVEVVLLIASLIILLSVNDETKIHASKTQSTIQDPPLPSFLPSPSCWWRDCPS